MPKFYSTKAGALCTRYGTGTYIGARLVVKDGVRSVEFDEDEVVSISDAEFSKYSREYLGMVAEGSLIERESEDFDSWCAKQTAASEADAPVAAAPVKAPEAAVAPAAKPALEK